MASRVQRAFAFGEWSPARAARADKAEYHQALTTCRNFLILRGGGIANRPGFQFVYNRGGSGRPRFMRFSVGTDQVYLVVVAGGAVVFFLEGVPVAGFACPWSATEALEVKAAHSIGAMVFTHPNHPPRIVTRDADGVFSIAEIETRAELDPPASGLTATKGSVGTLSRSYQVTAISGQREESVASSAFGVTLADLPTEEAPHVLAWGAVADAAEYGVYCDPFGNGVYGFLGVVTATSFRDAGIPPDFALTPPQGRTLFVDEGDYPGVVGNHQQRRIFAATANDPHAVFGSRIGFPNNFSISSPLQDDDAISFRIHGNLGQKVEHILPLKGFLLATESGLWEVLGNESRAITPSAIHPDQIGSTGFASQPAPVVMGTTVLFVEAGGSLLREMQFDNDSQGFDGRDLTVFADHLFDDYTIAGLSWGGVPYSIAWAVRSDGTLLSLTYPKGRPHEGEDDYGWARHDTLDGVFEDVIAIREGNVDAVYVGVRRTRPNGSAFRTIERLASRSIRQLDRDAFFVDCGITIDGWNTDQDVTMVLLEDTGWTVNDLIDISMSTGTFETAQLGDAVVLEARAADGTVLDSVRITIEAITDAANLRGRPTTDVPAIFRDGVPRWTWGWARKTVTGISHLEGWVVSILGDGHVVFNGDDAAPGAETFRVTAGVVTLPRAYVLIHAGLPITADAETLDVDAPGSDLRDKQKLSRAVGLLVASTGGVFAGKDAASLYEVQPAPLLGYDVAPPLVTGKVEVTIDASWEDHGRVFIRQTDPLPVSILAILTEGRIGG